MSGTATEFQVTLRWQPGYAGGPDYKQDYTIWYREAGFSEWTKVPVTPSGATSVSFHRSYLSSEARFPPAKRSRLYLHNICWRFHQEIFRRLIDTAKEKWAGSVLLFLPALSFPLDLRWWKQLMGPLGGNRALNRDLKIISTYWLILSPQQVTINRLQPGTTYEFQVNSKNTIGEGMMSKAITIRTLGKRRMSGWVNGLIWSAWVLSVYRNAFFMRI